MPSDKVQSIVFVMSWSVDLVFIPTPSGRAVERSIKQSSQCWTEVVFGSSLLSSGIVTLHITFNLFMCQIYCYDRICQDFLLLNFFPLFVPLTQMCFVIVSSFLSFPGTYTNPSSWKNSRGCFIVFQTLQSRKRRVMVTFKPHMD